MNEQANQQQADALKAYQEAVNELNALLDRAAAGDESVLELHVLVAKSKAWDTFWDYQSLLDKGQ